MICNTCHEEKSEEEFSFKNKAEGRRSKKCKQCQKIYARLHYLKNREAYIERAHKQGNSDREKTKALLIELKSDGCITCGENHPGCLVFHHRDPKRKIKAVSHMKGRKDMIEESKKCDVMCANCHGKLHWEENRGGVAQ